MGKKGCLWDFMEGVGRCCNTYIHTYAIAGFGAGTSIDCV